MGKEGTVARLAWDLWGVWDPMFNVFWGLWLKSECLNPSPSHTHKHAHTVLETAENNRTFFQNELLVPKL